MDSFEAFKEKLDQEHKWPDMYVFKFVVPVGKATEFKTAFQHEAFQEKKV
jgi:nitroreductase